MSPKKVLFGILGGCLAGLFTYLFLTRPENSLFLLELAAFGYLTYKKPFWGLIILLLLPLSGEFSRMTFVGRSLVVNDLLVPIFDLAALLNLSKKKLELPPLPALKPLLFFLCIGLASLLFSLLALPPAEVLAGSLYLFRLAFYIALFPVTYLLLPQTGLNGLIKWLALSALLIAIGGFMQLIWLPSLETLSETAGYDPHINRLVGTWLDPNFIGGFFAVISLLLISMGLYQKSTKIKVYYFGVTAILLAALFLTYSRSAYLAFFGGLLVLGIAKARKLLILILIISAIGLASSERAQQRVGELVTSVTSVLFNTSENPDPTARLRIQNWEQTLELIGQKPLLGHGYNTLTSVKLSEGFISSEETHSASGSDSSFLTILATTGLLGLITFIWFFMVVLRDSLHSWQHSKEPAVRGLGLGIFTGVIALLIHCNFVNSLFFPQIMIFFYPLLGAFYKNFSRPARSPRPISHP